MTDLMPTFAPNWRDRREDFPENMNDLPTEERARIMAERVRLLHVYGAAQWHGEVKIVGNRNALTVLRDALSAALEDGKAETSAMTTDGEGYAVEIEMNDAAWEHPAWEVLPLHYIDPIARGEPDPWWVVTELRGALRKANTQLVKRGVKPIPDPRPEQD